MPRSLNGPVDPTGQGVSMSRKLFTIVAALVIALLPVGAIAQTGPGTIAGVVKDSTGGTIPGAQVKVVNETTNASVDFVTNADGS